jgi:molybdenum cofactor cytidylyltransferase
MHPAAIIPFKDNRIIYLGLIRRKLLSISHSTAAIILAAGSSTRMGEDRHKLLLPLAGRPVLVHVIDAALASRARPIIVILGHQANQVRAQIAPFVTYPDITIIENSAYLEGMSTSMRLGVQALISHGYRKSTSAYQVDSALIMLGDQPMISSQVIDALINAYRATGKHIVAPLYSGKRGSPVLFDESLFPELMEVTGDEGGRTVLERHRQELETVEIGDAMANYDVDTWEAYQQILEAWERKRTE